MAIYNAMKNLAILFVGTINLVTCQAQVGQRQSSSSSAAMVNEYLVSPHMDADLVADMIVDMEQENWQEGQKKHQQHSSSNSKNAFLSSSSSSTKTSLDLAQAQIQWLESKGGQFDHQKSQIRHFFNSSAGHALGLFAVEDISEDTLLMTIPRSAMLTPGRFYCIGCGGGTARM
jgi:hypothetical protein